MTRIDSAILAALLVLAPSLVQAQQAFTAPRKTASFYPLDAAEAAPVLKAASHKLPTHGVTAALNDSGIVWTGTPEGVVRTASDGDV